MDEQSIWGFPFLDPNNEDRDSDRQKLFNTFLAASSIQVDFRSDDVLTSTAFQNHGFNVRKSDVIPPVSSVLKTRKTLPMWLES